MGLRGWRDTGKSGRLLVGIVWGCDIAGGEIPRLFHYGVVKDIILIAPELVMYFKSPSAVST